MSHFYHKVFADPQEDLKEQLKFFSNTNLYTQKTIETVSTKGMGLSWGEDYVSNEDYVEAHQMQVNSLTGLGKATGIWGRTYRSSRQNLVTMALEAYLKMVKLFPEVELEIEDFIRRNYPIKIVTAGSVGTQIPAMASIIHGALAKEGLLEIPPHQTSHEHMNSVCSSGAIGVENIRNSIVAGTARGGLLFTLGDYEGYGLVQRSKASHEDNIATEYRKKSGQALFGSAVTVSWISPSHFAKHVITPMITEADGRQARVIQQISIKNKNQLIEYENHAMPGEFYMEGTAVQNKAVDSLKWAIQSFLKQNELSEVHLNLIDHFSLHTGNQSMHRDALAKNYGIGLDKIGWIGTFLGNTDASGIFALDAANASLGHLSSGDILLRSTFGGGFQLKLWLEVFDGNLNRSAVKESYPYQSVALYDKHLASLKEGQPLRKAAQALPFLP